MSAGQLVRNYRSHSTLLRLPNTLFYRETLQAAADQRAVLPPEWAAQQLRSDQAASGDDDDEAWADGDMGGWPHPA